MNCTTTFLLLLLFVGFTDVVPTQLTVVQIVRVLFLFLLFFAGPSEGVTHRPHKYVTSRRVQISRNNRPAIARSSVKPTRVPVSTSSSRNCHVDSAIAFHASPRTHAKFLVLFSFFLSFSFFFFLAAESLN